MSCGTQETILYIYPIYIHPYRFIPLQRVGARSSTGKTMQACSFHSRLFLWQTTDIVHIWLL
ncbi:GL14117 [Drosophila persimilis]|uniref:GL14117 n=1 Tax=Drosophila persimilis TaxID=7234 RepID=B4IRT4_DROPE|nr:GL14117 [Drosophila persimilis]